MTTNSTSSSSRSSTSIAYLSPRRKGNKKERSIYGAGLLLLAFLIPQSGAGCSTPAGQRLPYLPSQPPDLTEELLRLEKDWVDLLSESVLCLERIVDGKTESMVIPLPKGTTILPTKDLELLWNDRADWRAYGLGQVRRGLWRKTDGDAGER